MIPKLNLRLFDIIRDSLIDTLRRQTEIYIVDPAPGPTRSKPNNGKIEDIGVGAGRTGAVSDGGDLRVYFGDVLKLTGEDSWEIWIKTSRLGKRGVESLVISHLRRRWRVHSWWNRKRDP